MPYGYPFSYHERHDGTGVALKKCWRCSITEVEESDELGLCPGCIDLLRDPDYTAPTPRGGPLQADLERAERLEREMRNND